MQVIFASPDWNVLLPELLLKIACSCSHTEGMMGVSRAWKSSLESVITKLMVKPELLLGLGPRFTSLASLDLRQCTAVSPEILVALKELPLLASLSMKLPPENFTDSISSALKGLSLERLDLDLETNTGFPPVSGPVMALLRGLPVVSLKILSNEIVPESIEVLRSLPLTDLDLAVKGLQIESYDMLGLLRGKNLMSLTVSRHVS